MYLVAQQVAWMGDVLFFCRDSLFLGGTRYKCSSLPSSDVGINCFIAVYSSFSTWSQNIISSSLSLWSTLQSFGTYNHFCFDYVVSLIMNHKYIGNEYDGRGNVYFDKGKASTQCQRRQKYFLYCLFQMTV